LCWNTADARGDPGTLPHELPAGVKRLPAASAASCAAWIRSPYEPWVRIAAGTAVLGQASDAFGWDNEFPRHTVRIDGFEVARHKLTHGEYLRFVDAGGPVPHFWIKRDGEWWLRRMFDAVPLPPDEPVYLTHRQAIAYAAWAGARLPSEPEWLRAAYGSGQRRYPGATTA
jgi:formylglycine-generating enzyme required for sulfatase activity